MPILTRLARIENELRALAILIDGRNARNGYCTWAMIAHGVEYSWQLARAALDGRPLDAELPPPPSAEARAVERELELLSDLAGELQRRASAVRAACVSSATVEAS